MHHTAIIGLGPVGAAAALLLARRDLSVAAIDRWLRVLRLGTPPLVEAEGVLAAWMDRHGALALLARPDHVVSGTAGDGPGLAALLAAAAAGLH